VLHTLETLAEARGETTVSVGEQVAANATAVFGLS
jgi:hypothetical protein